MALFPRAVALASVVTAVAACGPQPDHHAAETIPPLKVVRDPADPTVGLVDAVTTTTSTTIPAAAARPATARRASRSAASRSPVPPAGDGGGPSADVWHSLAMCESGMRQSATSPNGRYLSFFQWSLPTWRSVGGVGDPRTVSYETQVELAKRLQARSGWGQWPACSRKLGLR